MNRTPSRALGENGHSSTPPSQRLLDAVALGACAVVVLLVSALSFHQPLVADDYGTLFVVRDHPDIWGYLMYWYNNWSFTWPALLLQRAFVWSRLLYGLGNSLAFISLAGLSFGAATGRLPRWRRFDLLTVAFTACAYWFAAPQLAQTVSWSTGSAAYLWSAVLMLAFALPYSRWLLAAGSEAAPAPASVVPSLLMFALGLTAGSAPLQAITACGALLAMTALHTIGHRRLAKFPPRLWAGVAGFVAGAALTVTAPGYAARASILNTNGPQFEPALIAWYLRDLASAQLIRLYPWLAAIVIAAVALRVSLRSESRRSGVPGRPWLIWVACALASTLPLLIMPRFADPRTAFFPAVLLVAAALSYLTRGDTVRFEFPRAHAAVVTAAMIITLAATGASVYHADASARMISAELAERDEFIDRERRAGKVDLIVAPIDIAPAYGVLWWDLTENPDDFKNMQVALWHEVRSIRVDDRAPSR